MEVQVRNRREQPAAVIDKPVGMIGTPVREVHHGQGGQATRQQAGHMTANLQTNICTQSPCKTGAVHT